MGCRIAKSKLYPLSATLADGWQEGSAKVLERQNAALLQSQPVASS